MYRIFLLMVSCVLTNLVSTSDFEVDGMVTIRLQHYLMGNDETALEDRGNITIQSIRTGSVALAQVGLLSHHIDRLKALSQSDGVYRLRATATTADGRDTTFLTFTKACALAESGLSDTVTVSLDHIGNVMAVSLSAPFVVSQGTMSTDCQLHHFNTTVLVKHMENGPVPDTATYIQKLEREREARERGDPKDNRSFIAKYWMYLVPVLIFLLLSSAGQPEGGAGGNGGGR